MSRYVKEFLEIKEFTSLDELITKLGELRENLPESASA
jgi:hypothetical protein